MGEHPDANVGIACGASNLTVVDCDHGNATLDEATAWLTRSGLPETYTVRTGRRFMRDDPTTPECGVQLYYSGAMAGSGTFDIAGGSGEIQSNGDYVMAAGSVRPDSREEYVVLRDFPIAPLPEIVSSLESENGSTQRAQPWMRRRWKPVVSISSGTLQITI